MARFQRGQIHERLPRRSRLTAGLIGAVVAARGVIRAADIGAHAAETVQGHQGRLGGIGALQPRGPGADRGAGGDFGGHVEGGVDHQIEFRRADHLFELGVRPVDEILSRTRRRRFPHLRATGHGRRLLRRSNGAGLDHRLQHQGGTLGGGLGVFDGVVVGGRFHQRGQHGGLADGQSRRGGVEIALRRRLDAVGAGAEIHPAEIQAEDLVLAVCLLQFRGVDQLLALALQGAVGTEEQVFRQLLGDGRSALRGVAGSQIGDDGAGDAHGIEAGVVVKPPILDGDEGGRHIRRQARHVHRRRIAPAAHADQGSGPIEIGHLRIALDRGQGSHARDVQAEGGDETKHAGWLRKEGWGSRPSSVAPIGERQHNFR